MHGAGLMLLTIGFLAATLIAVLEPERIDLYSFLPWLGVAIIGVALAQWSRRRAAQSEETIEANFEALDQALKRVVLHLEELDADKEEVHVYDLPERIEKLFAEDLGIFADARESIRTVWGAQGYADVMTHFAAGERYLNRVWSTAADGYIDEAHTFLGRSCDQFKEALARLEGLHEGTASEHE